MNHIVHNTTITAHDHPSLEVAFVISGTARHQDVFGYRKLKAGQVIAIPRGCWHSYTDCRDLELYNLLLSPDLLANELGWLASLAEIPQMSYFHSNLHYQIGHWEITQRSLPGLCSDLERLWVNFQTRSRSRLGTVADILEALSYLTERDTASSSEIATKPDASPIVKRAIQLMMSHIDHPWTLTELADSLHLHPVSLIKFFHNATGQTPMKYLTSRRAGHAATLLLTSTKTVNEIGIVVGWPEPKHFARAFKRNFGCSATEYRVKMKQE